MLHSPFSDHFEVSEGEVLKLKRVKTSKMKSWKMSATCVSMASSTAGTRRFDIFHQTERRVAVAATEPRWSLRQPHRSPRTHMHTTYCLCISSVSWTDAQSDVCTGRQVVHLSFLSLVIDVDVRESARAPGGWCSGLHSEKRPTSPRSRRLEAAGCDPGQSLRQTRWTRTTFRIFVTTGKIYKEYTIFFIYYNIKMQHL